MELTGAMYLRVSAKEQREGISLDEQRKVLTQYAQNNGIHVVAVYEEDASTWKRNRNRDQFDAMMADAFDGKFERILVWKLDRFARTQREIHNAVVNLEEVGVFLILVCEGTDFSKMSRHSRTAVRGGMAIGTEIETLAKSDRAVMTNEHRRKSLGLFTTGRRGTGWAFNGKFKPSRIDEPRAEGVRFAFQAYATNTYSLTELVEELNKRSYTLSGGGRYTENALRHILHNRRYTGQILVDGKWLESSEPAIIPVELFDHVQRVLLLRSTAPRTVARKFRSHLLNGILYCSHCGSKMYVRNKRAYICVLTRTPGDRCPADEEAPKLITEGVLARQIDQLVGRLVLPQDWQRLVIDFLNGKDEQRDAEAERQRLEGQLERAKNLHIMGDLSLQEYIAKRDVIKAQLSLLVDRRPQDRMKTMKAGTYLEDLPALWSVATVGERRSMLEFVFPTLWLDRIERRICKARVYPEFAPLFEQLFESIEDRVFIL